MLDPISELPGEEQSVITSPNVYQLLDGIMANHPDQLDERTARRKRAVKRSQARVPYA